jgi:hypothetical protein
MKTLTLFVLTFFVLSSCGPSAKLRRAERLINEAVAAGAKVKADTVFVEKIIEGPQTTVEVPVDRMVLQLRDTVIYQDRIRIRYQLKYDTFRMQVECPKDTIRIPVTIHKSIIAPPCPKDRFWKGFGMGAAAILALLILYGVARLIKP